LFFCIEHSQNIIDSWQHFHTLMSASNPPTSHHQL
jgi:hypothetical protein